MLVLFFVSLLRAVDLSVDASSDWYWQCHFQVVRATPTHLLFLAPYSTHMRVSLFLSPISKWTPADLSYLLLYLQFPHSLFISSNYHEDFFWISVLFLHDLFATARFRTTIFQTACFPRILFWMVPFATTIFPTVTLSALCSNGYILNNTIHNR